MKDWSTSGKAYKRMLASNAARTEECSKYNSSWKPGALARLKARLRRVKQ
jgi:hypothetical protein